MCAVVVVWRHICGSSQRLPFFWQINLTENNIGGYYVHGSLHPTPEGPRAIAEAIRATASITVVDIRYNELDVESATMLAAVAKEKGVSLCGITPEQIEADFSSKMTGDCMNPADAILLTADLAVRTAMTSLHISSSGIGDEGVKTICEALKNNNTLKVLGLNASKFSGGEIGPQGAMYLAEMLSVNASLLSVCYAIDI